MKLIIPNFPSQNSDSSCPNQGLSFQMGQVGLVVLLISVIVLTIGIAVTSRSIIDVTITRQQEESNRALNAAESGVEQALSQDLNFAGNTFSGNVTVDGNIEVDYEIQKVTSLTTRVFEGVSAQVDVTGVTNGRSLRVRWSKEASCTDNPASLLVTVFNDNGGEVTARNFAYRPCPTPADPNFSEITTNPSGEYFRQVNIAMQTNDVMVRIKSVFADTSLDVASGTSGWTLPTQTYAVRSQAQNPLGEEVRVVQVNRTIPASPSVFDFVLYSGGTITK